MMTRAIFIPCGDHFTSPESHSQLPIQFISYVYAKITGQLITKLVRIENH